MKWYWISFSWATFGIATDEKGFVKITAPIGKWMKGSTIGRIKQYVQYKKGMIKKL